MYLATHLQKDYLLDVKNYVTLYVRLERSPAKGVVASVLTYCCRIRVCHYDVRHNAKYAKYWTTRRRPCSTWQYHDTVVH